PVRGVLLPGEFLPTAERAGLMGQIGAWVLDAACARLAAWSAHAGDGDHDRELIHDDPRVESTLAALGAMGVQLAVDDFGASVTSLARLPRIPVSVVKLARFADLGQREVVAAVIATAHGLGMSVVGGGIEDA